MSSEVNKMTTRNYARDEKSLLDDYRLARWGRGDSPDEVAKAVGRALDAYDGESTAMQRARTLAIVLERSQIDINPNTPFSSKLNLGCNYDGQFVSSFAYERIFAARMGKKVKELFPRLSEKREQSRKMGISIPSLDYGHICPDWRSLMKLGLKGLLDRAAESEAALRSKNELTAEREDFFRALKMCYEAIFGYMDRLIEAGKEKGVDDFVECIKNLKQSPPATLYEAMELSLLFLEIVEIGVERARSLGNIDELYYPFYKKALDDGTLTRESAKELFGFYLAKIYSAKRYANQPLCIGGSDENGRTRVSDMTYLFVETYCEMNITNPKIHVCCTSDTPEKLYDMLFRAIRNKVSSIVFISDEQIMRAYEKIGIGRDLSRDYIPIGCYEPVIQGREDARICGSWINLAKGVEFAIHGGYDAMTGELFGDRTNPEPETFDEFMEIVKRHLAAFVDFTKKAIEELYEKSALIYATPLYSSTFSHCVKTGTDMFAGGAEIRNASIKVFAVGTAVDSILAVKKYVYDKKELSLRNFGKILKDDWRGAESLRTRIQNDAPKWGCGDEEADRIAKDLFGYMAKLIVGTPAKFGGVYRMGCDSVDMSRIYAVGTGASADGRKAGTPLTRNLRPENGMERNGVTGFIRSVCGVDFTDFCDGAPIDVLLHPSAVEGDKGIEMMKALLKVYFANGGSAFQGNVFDPSVLEEAQRHPEDYRDLQVRVCGWNEYFVNLDKTVQDDFIARAKGME